TRSPMTWPGPACPVSCGSRANSTCGAGFTPRWSSNAAKAAGGPLRKWIYPDFSSKKRRNVADLKRLYRQKLAGIIPRPANRPPIGSGLERHTMPAKRATAKAVKPKKVEKPKLTAKKPAAKPVAAKSAAKPTPAKPAAKAAAPAKPAVAQPKPAPAATPAPAANPVAQAIRKAPPSERIVVTANGVPSTGLATAPRAANDSDADESPEAGSLLAGPRNVTPYITKRGEAYMNKEQLEHFRNILNGWKRDLMEEVDRTVSHMKDE